MCSLQFFICVSLCVVVSCQDRDMVLCYIFDFTCCWSSLPEHWELTAAINSQRSVCSDLRGSTGQRYIWQEKSKSSLLATCCKKSSFNASDQPSDQRPVDFEEIQKKGKHEVSLAYLIWFVRLCLKNRSHMGRAFTQASSSLHYILWKLYYFPPLLLWNFTSISI